MSRTDNPSSAAPRAASLVEALVPVIVLIVLLREAIVRFEGTAHIPLLLATGVAMAMGMRLGHRFKDLEEGLVEGITIGLKATLILLVVGILIGMWMVAGIVPAMIFHGLGLLSPSIFLAAACAICCVVSIATGSSWTTAGTVGIALIGIGNGLHVSPAMTAGAIVSGAYFGDKLSPLSDTTNLAPAVAGSELFEHVRYMLWTTLPGIGLALLAYALLGGRSGGADVDPAGVNAIRDTLEGSFSMHPILLLPVVLVIGLAVFRVPALPALAAGAVTAVPIALLVQGAGAGSILAAAQSGYVGRTGVASVDELLTRGGLESMLPTVSLILCALAFGGAMEKAGLLQTLGRGVLRLASTTPRLVAATLATCMGMNALAPDQYLSIVVPGRMFRDAYTERGLEPRLLSRTLEDGGTLSSALVPWNTCGAYMGATLGISAAAYAPYAFFNLLCPVIALILASRGWGILVARTRAEG